MLFQWLVPALALAMCLLISWLASRSNRTMRESERVLDDRGRGDPVSDEDVREPRAAEQPAREGEPERQPVA
ncbi:MAG: hypothetical protein IJH84_10135 [Saccharopolyspora sp.]|uniref:hypothetical protein n=1 Tax=Saccharopolyspora TaxID=1835 RepID=UPI00190BDB2D|nr:MULTISPECIES: hypothetical protein [unclassified Saccharopolyspora]MBK0869873.1 hypothetical protein [Saccharopolyspora sp. HNM0986]MBQ6641377.1 hypothetical protein [Saccharopolyspora sp.]